MWTIVLIGLFFMVSPGIYFPKKGRPQEGKTTMDTTVLVDSGAYGIVRHSQFLSCIMLISASILVSQHWLSAIVGIPISVWGYIGYLPKEEKGLIIRFGDDYEHYMQKVPILNLCWESYGFYVERENEKFIRRLICEKFKRDKSRIPGHH